MLHPRFLCALAVLALAALSPAWARAQAAGGAEVALRFTAFDKENREVATLAAGDLKLTEDGRPRAVASVRRASETPLALVVALDASHSQERILGHTKPPAEAFVRELIRPGVDEVAVVTFTGEATLEQGLTSDAAKVGGTIRRARVVPLAGALVAGDDPLVASSTAIWDTVWVISEDILAREPKEVRRAILLVTDGVDTGSDKKLSEAITGALRAEAAVYVVGVADREEYDPVQKGELRRLAERTGGRAFFPKKADELPAVFAQVRRELLSPYVVTFAAPDARRAGALRKVKLEVVNPELRRLGVRLSHPEGYFAQ